MSGRTAARLGRVARVEGVLGRLRALRGQRPDWSEPRRTRRGRSEHKCLDHSTGDVDRRLPRDRRNKPVAGGADPAGKPPVQRSGRLRHPLFTAEASADGSRWRYRFTLSDPDGLRYTAHHQSGEPSMCTLPDGRVMMVYYSYDESIFRGLADENYLNPLVRSEMERIPHMFKRRPCRAILIDTADAG